MIRIYAIEAGQVQLVPQAAPPSSAGAAAEAEPPLPSAGAPARTSQALEFELEPLLARPFPVYCWLLETERGPVLIDTGPAAYAQGAADVRRTAHPRLRYKFTMRFTVSADQELAAQLHRRGVALADVRTIILTHLHPDHAGGMQFFPHAEIYVARGEHDYAQRRPAGFGVTRWPAWFSPHLIDFEPWPIGPFADSVALPGVRGAWLVPTPGHTLGHLSVLLEGAEHWTLIAGDAAYSQASMLEGRLIGQADDPRRARQTFGAIRELARQHPLLFLPAHDADAPRRLAEGILLPG